MNGAAGNINGNQTDPVQLIADIQAKYQTERNKRLRPDFNEQYVAVHKSDKFKHFAEDPWLPSTGAVPGFQLREGEVRRFKFVLKGAGYGALLYAARLVEAGFESKDFAFLDYAGGFGGTWYWNRYVSQACHTSAALSRQDRFILRHTDR